ncbi:MAG: hypothetical protein WHT06_08610 [Desulfobacterales bacterium]
MKKKGAIKFVVWGALSLALAVYVFYAHESGKIDQMYYHSTKIEGYAINTNQFLNATKENPARLQIGPAEEINGLMAVPVKKGDRLPKGANGVIDKKVVEEGKRAKIEGDKLVVMVPWQIKESKGFKYKDTFMHKGVKTDPWSGVWNVAMTIALGLCLGFMAEGFTDLLGWKIKKIEHFGH